MRIIIGLITVLVFLFFSPFVKPVSATAPAITAFPSGILSLDTSFTVTATMSGLSKSAIYRLRVALSQPGTSNYFGSTYDGATWHMGSIADGNFLTITTDAIGVWGGDIQGKIDSDDPNFTTGSGTYDLKVGRYTQTGSTATWSDPVSITIVVPPTPTPTNTPIPTPTSVPTSIPTQTPTASPAPTPSRTPTPTLKPSLSPTPKEILPTGVLGESTESGKIVSPTDEPLDKNTSVSNPPKNKDNNFLKIIMFVGIVFIVPCAIVGFREFKKRKLMQNE